MVLAPSEIRSFYDRFGKKQDTQSFYEEPALDDLVAHADFGHAASVFEFGCGTGRFAARLLEEQLPGSASYLGCDLSSTMVALANSRLTKHEARASALLADGTPTIPLPDDSVDRIVSTYVLDLLSVENIREFFGEAHRTLKPGGKLCLVALTRGTTFLSRLVAGGWAAVYRFNASVVGGCRPILLDRYADPSQWRIEHRNVVVAFGVPSEVLITTPATGERTPL